MPRSKAKRKAHADPPDGAHRGRVCAYLTHHLQLAPAKVAKRPKTAKHDDEDADEDKRTVSKPGKVKPPRQQDDEAADDAPVVKSRQRAAASSRPKTKDPPPPRLDNAETDTKKASDEPRPSKGKQKAAQSVDEEGTSVAAMFASRLRLTRCIDRTLPAPASGKSAKHAKTEAASEAKAKAAKSKSSKDRAPVEDSDDDDAAPLVKAKTKRKKDAVVAEKSAKEAKAEVSSKAERATHGVEDPDGGAPLAKAKTKRGKADPPQVEEPVAPAKNRKRRVDGENDAPHEGKAPARKKSRPPDGETEGAGASAGAGKVLRSKAP